MTKSDDILELAKKNNGYITTKEVRDANINSTEITRLVKECKLEKVSRGIYCTPNSFHDDYYKILSKSNKAIYSHDSALYFHDLSDRIPIVLDITVPFGYNGSLRTLDNTQLHYVKKDVFELGQITIKSPFGMEIKIYDIERTICDIIKSKNKIDIEIFVKALQKYSKSRNKDLNKLMRYAKKLNIEKKVREYMEVLL